MNKIPYFECDDKAVNAFLLLSEEKRELIMLNFSKGFPK